MTPRHPPAGALAALALLCACGDPGPSEPDLGGEIADLRDLFPDVDGLFDLLEEALERDAWEIRVTWDEGSGAPADFWIDYDQRVADEELGFRMVSAPRPDASSSRLGAPYSPGAHPAPPAAATTPSRSPS